MGNFFYFLRNEEATQAFSASLQMADASCRPWAYWGDHLENVYLKEKQKFDFLATIFNLNHFGKIFYTFFPVYFSLVLNNFSNKFPFIS